MNEPTPEEMFRAAAALFPFVRRWDLSLNPEDLDEIAYAVLLHARSEGPVDDIPAAVDRQIDEHEEKARQMYEAMAAAALRKKEQR